MYGIIRISLLLAIPLVLSSCYISHSIPIEIVRPGEIEIPGNINNIVILNRSLITISDSILADSVIVIETIPEYLYNVASTSAVRNLAEIIAEIPSRISAYPENVLETLPEDSIYVKPVLSVYELLEIDLEPDVNGLISLDYLSITDSLVSDVNYPFSSGAFIPSFVAGIHRRITAIWRFYDLNESELIDEFISRKLLLFFSPNSEWDVFTATNLLLTDVNFILETYEETGWKTGYGYARRIIPVFIPEERTIYSGRYIWLRRSFRRIVNNRWKDAEDLLLTHTRHENPRKAAAAFYNLGFISEMESDLQQARFFVEMSIKRHPSAKARNYHQILEKRIEEKPGIDELLIF